MVSREKSKGLFIFALLITGAFLFRDVHAQTQETELISDYELTLDEAIRIAVANSPQVKRALLSVEDADELVKIAYSEVYPNISSAASYSRDIEPQVFFITDSTGNVNQLQIGADNSWQASISVSQTLFRGETIVGLSSATVFKTVQEENLRAATQQLITQTRIAYYSVLAAQEQLRLQETQIQRLEQNLEENEIRQKAGLLDEYAVLSLRVQLSNQKPQLIEAEYALAEAYRILKITLGLPLGFEFNVLGNLNEFDILGDETNQEVNGHIALVDQMNPFTFQKEGLDSLGLELMRGDLRILDASLALNQKEVTATKSRFLPTVTASYNLSWNSPDPDPIEFFPDPRVRFQTLGVNVSLPLFQGFKRVADVQRVQIARKDLEEQKRAAMLNAQNEVASASEDLNRAFETAEARKIALQQANEGYERAQKRLENGLGSQLEVTDAEVQVRQAEVNYALMVYQYLTAKAEYDLATGKVPFVDTEIEE